jgi:hypothetical protein
MQLTHAGRFLLVVVGALILAGPSYAQDEETLADIVKAECKDFKSTYKKKSDEEVTAQIDHLLSMYKEKQADAKIKKDVVIHIALAARLRSNEVAAHALKALGETDDVALKYIEVALKSSLKAKPPQTERYEACFASLGKLSSLKSVKTLTGYLKYKDYDVIAQSAAALQGYKGAKGAVRKQVFEEILKNSEGVYSGAQANENSEPYRKWQVISTDMMDALNAISHKEFSDPKAARSWWNEVKKKNWDKLE